jgi:4-amino-4-deoxy-L-arabinose transferase-like glycosyltransferase
MSDSDQPDLDEVQESSEGESDEQTRERDGKAPQREEPERSATERARPADPRDPEAQHSEPAANQPHWLRGTLLAVAGALVPFLIMATDRRWSFSVPAGLGGCLVAFVGIADMLGTFEDPEKLVSARPEGERLRPAVLELVTAVAAWFMSLKLAVAGSLPLPVLTAAITITGTFLWIVAAGFRAAQALGAFQRDEAGQPRSLLRRHGFWLIALTTVVYLPLLGAYSLSDPWETHYGEVAREMLARDDWISLWWAQDGWFWSKPVLDFWVQGLAFSALGVKYMPDQMLASVAQGRVPQPEWAARIGVFLVTVAGVYFMYKAVAKVCGRRAGLLGGIVLTTMPYWFLIAHQSMTDMLYVGPLTAAMGLLLLGFHTDPDERIGVYELSLGSRKLHLSAWHAVFGAVVLIVLPQVLYLFTRNLTLHWDGGPHGFRWHLDQFFSGSGGGNCGLPGNEDCRYNLSPVNKSFQPWHAATSWAAVGGALPWINRTERRRASMYFLGAWLFVALSVMGKGAPGLVLPIFVAGAYVGATRRWRDLPRMELLSMVLMIVCLALPWYVQMYMRHGQPFTDRLLFHDMYKRAFVHVHDTNVGDDTSFRYYVWQLGYGLFPWTGIAAGGLLWWLRRSNDRDDPRGDVGSFLALWFVAAFGMFTITLTKFHHYVFPVVPPTAMLIGLMLDRAIDERELPEPRRLLGYLAGLGVSATLLVYGAFRFFPGSLTGREIAGQPPPRVVWLAVASLLAGGAIAGWTIATFGRRPAREASGAGADSAISPVDAVALSSQLELSTNGTLSASSSDVDERSYTELLIAAIAVASAVVLLLAGRDMFTTLRGDIEGQARLMHLFTYNYRRPWPDSLSFNGILAGFTFATAGMTLLMAVPRLRTHATVLFLAASVLWCAWGVNVYLFKAAPHWGQRETVMAYYADRKGADEPFVAYQMNWKGENFYTGNRTPAWVSSGQKFKDWIEEQKKKGVRTMYFTTEHGRSNALKGEIGQVQSFDEITNQELNNKFFVGRARF